jgi:hypothetical protein
LDGGKVKRPVWAPGARADTGVGQAAGGRLACRSGGEAASEGQAHIAAWRQESRPRVRRHLEHNPPLPSTDSKPHRECARVGSHVFSGHVAAHPGAVVAGGSACAAICTTQRQAGPAFGAERNAGSTQACGIKNGAIGGCVCASTLLRPCHAATSSSAASQCGNMRLTSGWLCRPASQTRLHAPPSHAAPPAHRQQSPAARAETQAARQRQQHLSSRRPESAPPCPPAAARGRAWPRTAITCITRARCVGRGRRAGCASLGLSGASRSHKRAIDECCLGDLYSWVGS